VKKEVDVTGFGVTSSYAKYQVIDMSVPMMIEPWHIVVPWPKEESRLLAPIRPFQPPVMNIFVQKLKLIMLNQSKE
jgi:hypothetical protein